MNFVTYAFQKTKSGNQNLDEAPMFFAYKITGKKNKRPDQLYVDLDYGIILNPSAIDFLKRYNNILITINSHNINVILPPIKMVVSNVTRLIIPHDITCGVYIIYFGNIKYIATIDTTIIDTHPQIQKYICELIALFS